MYILASVEVLGTRDVYDDGLGDRACDDILSAELLIRISDVKLPK